MERRYVGIRNWQFANFVVIHFSNSVEVKVEQTNTGLKSTKSGKHHGIGMSSIQRSISKYGGEISYSCTEDEFVLKIILPVNVTVEMQD